MTGEQMYAGRVAVAPKPLSRMRLFDPHKLAYYEKENYVRYYQRRWFALMRATVGLVRESFGLNLFQGIYGAYLIASAEFAWAPAEHDVTVVQRKLRRFYEFVRRVNRETFDLETTTRHEFEWWVAHREHFGDPDNSSVVEAFTQLDAALFQVDAARVREAAYWRAAAVLFSDWWVEEGQDPNSPLLEREENAFRVSYSLLREVASSRT